MILSIYEDIKFGQPPTMILGQNFRFLKSWCMVKLDLEMMFIDVLESLRGHVGDIWRCQMLMAAILDFFQRG